MTVSRSTSLALAAAAALIGGQAVAARPLPAAMQSPAQRMAAIQQQASQQHAAAQAAGTADNTAPVLTRFSLVGDVNAQSVNPKEDLDVTMSDEMSGLTTYIINLKGPSGQMVQRVETMYGQMKVDGRISIGAQLLGTPSFSRFSEPGTWQVDSVFLSDGNFNMKMYWPEDIATLGGRTSFAVKNTKGYDITPPTLTSGSVETPKLSLSTPPAGTPVGTLPYASVKLGTADSGNGAVAGVLEAIVELCLANQFADCVDTIELHGHVGQVGQDAATFRALAQLRSDQTPGVYQILNVFVIDSAQNNVLLQSDKLGGGDDLSKYFPGGITLKVSK
ncbi:MAG TPA: hypothetical protein VLA61_11130 [Ideonella sp.]|uniref:hypothetical protein n=1 Tax=Ideonella sp. TaxID=1929293 RepID=UPI002C8A0E78|nr:hypothetical protein [Ideonella sp.]HSI48816.1 hypothetical protein [Ideonella sp.]